MKQFSIADLLIVTAIIALALAWWTDRKNSAAPATHYDMQVVQGHAFPNGTLSGEFPLEAAVAPE